MLLNIKRPWRARCVHFPRRNHQVCAQLTKLSPPGPFTKCELYQARKPRFPYARVILHPIPDSCAIKKRRRRRATRMNRRTTPSVNQIEFGLPKESAIIFLSCVPTGSLTSPKIELEKHRLFNSTPSLSTLRTHGTLAQSPRLCRARFPKPIPGKSTPTFPSQRRTRTRVRSPLCT